MFLVPMQLAESAKSQFSCRDYSDHLALVRAYEGWREAEREQSGYEYCWRNFLSAQTLRAIDSLRKQFMSLLRDAGLFDDSSGVSNRWSQDENLVRAVLCAGLYPGVCSVVVSLSLPCVWVLAPLLIALAHRTECEFSFNSSRTRRSPYP